MGKLSMIGQMKKEAERDFTKFVKYVAELEEENRKLKEERDFFKEQAILWRKDWKVAYEENRKLKERIEELEK